MKRIISKEEEERRRGMKQRRLRKWRKKIRKYDSRLQASTPTQMHVEKEASRSLKKKARGGQP